MRTRILSVALAALAVVGIVAASAPSAERAKGKDAFAKSAKLRKAVKAKGLMRRLEAFQSIADASGGNREAGTPGYKRSAGYVARVMRRAGYRVQRDEFDFELFHEDAEATFEQTAPGAVEYEYGEDFVTAEYSGPGDVTAEVVAIDLMIPPGAEENSSSSGCEAADFEGVDVTGKVALMQRGTCSFGEKADNAAAAGAAAAILFNEGQPGRTELLGATLAAPLRDIPVIGTTFALGEDLANGQVEGATGITVGIATDTWSEILTTENVIAQSRRGDRDNVVMAGAHLDSVGDGPGINDNGSGSAGLLETAVKISKLGIKPKNRLRFAWWGAEEAGLVGSTQYVSELTDAQAAKIALYLNFDMIGSPNFARFIYDGNGSAFGLEGPDGSDTIERAFQRYFERKGLPSGQTAFDGRSDYFPFIQVGIPAGGLFTGAEGVKTEHEQAVYGGTAGEAYDPCYHAACDDIDNISRRGFGQMADALAHAVHQFAFNLKFVRAEEPVERRARSRTERSPRALRGDRLIR